jgi:hypothetical protein
MTVGEFSAFQKVRDAFGIESFMFYIPYQLFMIMIILSFPRAVLNAGYDDSRRNFEEAEKKKESRLAADKGTNEKGMVGKCLEPIVGLVKLIPPELKPQSLLEGAKQYKGYKIQNKRTAMMLYLAFCALYSTLAILIMRTNVSFRLTQMVEEAFKQPTFSKTNPITGQVIRGTNFDAISTQEDVQVYLREVLPAVLYKLSRGTFDGQPNALINYSSAPEYKQLVLQNWNILVGQLPARMTVKLSKLEEIGTDGEIKGVLNRTHLRRVKDDPENGRHSLVGKDDMMPDANFVEQDSLNGIILGGARDFLTKHCNYSFGYGAVAEVSESSDLSGYEAAANGFVCQLSVNETATVEMLSELSRGANGLITSQTLALTIEFVMYNAFAMTFMYVVIGFGFQPSGIILKSISVEPVSLELTAGVFGAVVTALVILVLIFNCYYFFMNMIDLFQKVCKAVPLKYEGRPPHEHGKIHMRERIPVMIRQFLYYYILDGFNALDLLSCFATFFTLFLFFQYSNSQALSSSYFFQENPEWISGKCASNGFLWCSDTQIITQFFMAKDRFKTFGRIAALNTIFVYWRMLRYLKSFRHMRVIFSTLIKGVEDILWFVVIFFVLLVGYMQMGYITFGSNYAKFSDHASALVGCFEVYLGKFDSQALAEASLSVMIIYIMTFWVVFKLIVMNMFLAIIDKNYNLLNEERDREEANGMHGYGKKKAGGMAMITGFFSRGGSKGKTNGLQQSSTEDLAIPVDDNPIQAEPEGGTGEAPNQFALTNGETGGSGEQQDEIARQKSNQANVHAEDEEEHDYRVPAIKEEGVTNEYWRNLPEEVRKWSLDKANDVAKFINSKQVQEGNPNSATNGVAEQAKSSGGDNPLNWAQRVSTKIDKKREEYQREAENEKEGLEQYELKNLRKVHQDQESLSWYIIKRDHELKKLEEAKKVKEERFDKMVQAAQSLIREEDGGGDKMGFMNKR